MNIAFRRRRFQFSLRTLLIVTAIIAIPCGWLAMKMEGVEAIRELGYSLVFDYQRDADGKPLPDSASSKQIAPGPAALRYVLGDDFFRTAVEVDNLSLEIDDEHSKVFLRGLNHLQRDALKIPRSRFAYIAPTYKQAKNVAWDATLRTMSGARQLPMAELIRMSIELFIKYEAGASREAIVARAIEVVGRFSSGSHDGATEHDKHLADAFGAS